MQDVSRTRWQRAKSILKWASMFLVSFVVFGVFVYNSRPEWIAMLWTKYQRSNAGLSVETLQVGDWEIPYMVGGGSNEETVVLIHGFASSKDVFIGLAERLSESYRVLAPDMPGSGDTESRLDETYNNDLFTETIEGFLNALDVRRCHLVGESLGGAHCAMAASRNPKLVKSLVLLAPPGIQGSQPSEFDEMAKQGHHPMIFHDRDGLERGIGMLLNEVPEIPDVAWRAMLRQGLSRRELNTKMFNDLLSSRDVDEFSLQVAAIEPPTLLFWGELDRICDVSASHKWKECNANLQVRRLPDTGHGLLFEEFEVICDAIIDHLERNSATFANSRVGEEQRME